MLCEQYHISHEFPECRRMVHGLRHVLKDCIYQSPRTRVAKA
jgi:hypothetical protein